PPGQTLERYRQMLMLDFLVADAVPASLALRKIEELRQRRETDPTVYYDVLLKDDGSAVLLDFTMSGHTDDGTSIIEWNAYRYEAVPGGVVLLGISRRGYGQDDGRRFLAE